MGQGKLYGQKPNDIDFSIGKLIKDYYVYAGQNISAGTFVEYIEGVAGQTTSTTTTTINSTTKGFGVGTICEALKLSDDKVLLVYAYDNSNYYLYGRILTIVDSKITVHTAVQLSEYKNSGREITPVLYSNNTVFIAHARGATKYSVYGTLLTISGTTITVADTTQIQYTDSASCPDITATKTDDYYSTIFVAYTMGDTVYGKNIRIANNEIGMGSSQTATQISDTYGTYMGGLSAVCKDSGYVLLAHQTDKNDEELVLHLLEISSYSITKRSDKTISFDYKYTDYTLTKLSSTSFLLVYGYYGRGRYGKIITVSGISISTGSGYDILQKYAMSISVVKMSSTKVAICYIERASGGIVLSYQMGAIYTISGTTITEQSIVNLETIEDVTSISCTLSNTSGDNFIVVADYDNDEDDYRLHGQVFKIKNNSFSTEFEKTETILVPTYETQVRKVTSSNIYGVAKTSGTGGDSTSHKDKIQIYTL